MMDSEDSSSRIAMPLDAYLDSDASPVRTNSNWQQNHGTLLLAVAVFMVIVGCGFIFFNNSGSTDNTKPLVPNNFVPDDVDSPDHVDSTDQGSEENEKTAEQQAG